MHYKKLRIPVESAVEVIRSLGELQNSITFEDLTKNSIEDRKNFGEIIKRIDEVKKKLKDFTRICYDFHLPYENYKTFQDFKNDYDKDYKERNKVSGSTYFDLLENEILENDRRINELIDSHLQVRENLVSLIERKHVLKKTEELIQSNYQYSNFASSEADESGVSSSIGGSNLSFMSGVILTEHEMKMKRMVFRVSRGRAVTTFFNLDINDEEYLLTSGVSERGFLQERNQGTQVIGNYEKLNSFFQSKDYGIRTTQKKIFSIIFPGSEGNVLQQKIIKICDIFQASRYPVPKASEVKNEVENIIREIGEKKGLLMAIEKDLQEFILRCNVFNGKQNIRYSMYRIFVEQEKLVYTTLNKCKVNNTFIDAHVWIPNDALTSVNTVINNLFFGQDNKETAQIIDLEIKEDTVPPTYTPVNEFTSIFQLVVDTYGVPHYQEANPGYLTIITFPFLFGVMFGDIGHGLILFIFGIIVLLNKDKFTKGYLKMFADARYFILLMGFFSMFCGTLYNDFLSVPLYLTSCYPKKGELKESLQKTDPNCTHKYGVDPIWYAASNELTFINSLKMKLSVIFGVIQMIVGIILKGTNAIFKRELVEFFFVVIPQFILMISLFGYMDFLIFYKWNINYNEEEFRAPDIKNVLMNIFLRFGNMPPKPRISKEGQKEEVEFTWKFLTSDENMKKIHLAIFFISIVSVLIMFLPKLFINYSRAKKKNENKNNPINNISNDLNNIDDNPIHQNNEEMGFSDFFVSGLIETVEFVLGTVSNTASYLRLWALSLAHTQLSKVCFEKLIGLVGNLTDNFILNGIVLAYIFIIFSSLSFFVLMFMDLMECFLHTLRLHWVEFQGKFYKGDGYKFEAFCFEQLIPLEEEEFKV